MIPPERKLLTVGGVSVNITRFLSMIASLVGNSISLKGRKVSMPLVEFPPDADAMEGGRKVVPAKCALDPNQLPEPGPCPGPVCGAHLVRTRLHWKVKGEKFLLDVTCPGYRCPVESCGIELLTSDVHAALLRDAAAPTARKFGERAFAKELEAEATAIEASTTH